MSTAEWEIFFNVLCLGISIALGGFMIVMYRLWPPKFYGLLFWALFLTLGAAFTFGLYSSLLDAFLAMKSTDGQVLVARTRLAENMRLLAFAVPALMLSVASNLITSFLQAPARTKTAKNNSL
ncbi:hypothetical protein [Burkholderia pseudomallei]|uniref:hypothetical protein n=1 Tax=Burkholderia pseudomallei TaxID=28450 RepID=UPI0027DF7B39|nr:hypothetical protein [Burkholderia pseudomallei]